MAVNVRTAKRFFSTTINMALLPWISRNTALTLLKAEKPAEEPELRHLTDDEIIRGFKYLMNKDRKDK